MNARAMESNFNVLIITKLFIYHLLMKMEIKRVVLFLAVLAEVVDVDADSNFCSLLVVAVSSCSDVKCHILTILCPPATNNFI